MRSQRTLILAACAALVATPALAGMIDFEDLGVAAGTQLNPASGVSQNTGGFTVAPGPNNASGLNDLHFHNQNGVGNNGSTHLGTHDDVVFTLIGGGVFSVFSFDFEGFITESGLMVEGTLSGGGTVSQTITPDGNPNTYQSFSLSGFQNLTKVSFNYLGNGSNGFFLDNIDTGARIPEPGALGLAGLGLIALALSRRKAR